MAKKNSRKPLRFTDDEKNRMISGAMKNIRFTLGLDKPKPDPSQPKLNWEK